MSNKILKHAYSFLLVAAMLLATVAPIAVDEVYALDMEVVSEVAEEVNTKEIREAVNEAADETVQQIIKEQEEQKAKEEAERLANMTIEERIQMACEEYGIDFDITLAIARLETGWFKSYAYIYGNNPGGLSVNEQPLYFDTIEEGVDRFVSNLAENYFGIGLTTPELIGQKYCPSNPEWSALVRELMSYGY